MAADKASSFKAWGRPLQGSSQKDKSPDLNFLIQYLAVRSFTVLSQTLGIFSDLMQISDKLTLKSRNKQHRTRSFDTYIYLRNVQVTNDETAEWTCFYND
ncbi:hypothetical protein NPIL_71671 [Nephila pilipes]|uniref:Uncharacterized protein n=1 Tax=Nephila pilipes TaxID=299642 RepID=A0A8X6UTE4_NEPPI|nr:hypothetical protein NPIL_71671 [Nephila pilipes]